VGAYVVRRLLWLPVLLVIVSFSTFTLARFGPGDPVTLETQKSRDPAVVAEARAKRGLDRPIPVQYLRWLQLAARGDLGESTLQKGYSVSELIFPKMWVSAQLSLVAIIIVFAVGIPMGLLAARLAGTWIDPMIIGTLLFLQAIPVLVVIPPLIWLFAVKLQWLPVGGWDGIFAVYWIGGVVAIPIPNPHLYIPLVAFTIGGFVGVARLVRITALEVNLEDYVRTARSKGLSETAVQLRHVLPNALLPVVTVVGFSLAGIIEGSFFVETLMGINGIGRLTFEAVTSRDYDVILATTVVFASAFVICNLLAELVYGVVDPRVRLGATRG